MTSVHSDSMKRYALAAARPAVAGIGRVRRRAQRRPVGAPRAHDGASRARRDGGAVQRPERNYSLDVDYEYRQDSNLYYLTGHRPGRHDPRADAGQRDAARDPVRHASGIRDREHWNGRLPVARGGRRRRRGIETVLATQTSSSRSSRAMLGRRRIGAPSTSRRRRVLRGARRRPRARRARPRPGRRRRRSARARPRSSRAGFANGSSAFRPSTRRRCSPSCG